MTYRIAIGYPLGLTLSDEDNSPRYCLELMNKRVLLSVKEFSTWVMALSGDPLPQMENQAQYETLLESKHIIEIDPEQDIVSTFKHHYAIRQGCGSVALDQTPCVSFGGNPIEMSITQMQVWQSMCSSIDLSKIVRWLLTIMSTNDILEAFAFLMQKELLYII